MRAMRKAGMSHDNGVYRILDPERPDDDFKGQCALTVMAKAPVPGNVKTRLSPPLTPAEAAALNVCFLRDTVASLKDVAAVDHGASSAWLISYTPKGQEMAFDEVLPEDALLLPQRGDGFGERLMNTAQDLFACGFSAVCLIDSDSPTVPPAEYRRAVEELARPGPRAVLGPSSDGGYYLIGLKQMHARLFDEISWSTDLVCAQTLERASEIDLPVTLLETWYDVDEAQSLERLRSELMDPASRWPHGYPALHTRAYLFDLQRAGAGSTARRSLA